MGIGLIRMFGGVLKRSRFFGEFLGGSKGLEEFALVDYCRFIDFSSRVRFIDSLRQFVSQILYPMFFKILQVSNPRPPRVISPASTNIMAHRLYVSLRQLCHVPIA